MDTQAYTAKTYDSTISCVGIALGKVPLITLSIEETRTLLTIRDSWLAACTTYRLLPYVMPDEEEIVAHEVDEQLAFNLKFSDGEILPQMINSIEDFQTIVYWYWMKRCRKCTQRIHLD